jgi:two-component system, OmpR family, KDP operon response regulator KdpE
MSPAAPPLCVMIVDADQPMRQMLAAVLATDGHETIEAASAREAERLVTRHRIDFFLVEVSLPDMSGLQLIKRLRSASERPIVVVSMYGQETNQVSALDAGADDYIVKPPRLDELRARMRAVQRRAESRTAASPTCWQVGALTIDLRARTATRASGPARLTAKQWDLLDALCRRGGEAVTVRDLLKSVWGSDDMALAACLRNHIKRLRAILEAEPAEPRLLLNEKGLGYRLSATPVRNATH